MSIADHQSPLLGRLAVHYQLITPDQLAEVLGVLGRSVGSKKLGETLVERGLLRVAQLDQLLRVQEQVIAKHRAEATKQRPPGSGFVTSDDVGASPEPHDSETTKTSGGTPGPTSPSSEGEASAAAKALGLGPAMASASSSVPTSATPRIAPAAAAKAQPPVPSTEPSSSPAPSATTPVISGAVSPSETRTSVAHVTSREPRPHTPDADARIEIERLLVDAVRAGASDVHLHSAVPVRHRRNGKLVTVGDAPLDAARLEKMIFSLLTSEQHETLVREGELDLCLPIADAARFRTNLYHQQRGIDGVFRAIPPHPPTLEQLGLPSTLAKLVHFHQGMVLITGPAGCGKSSTMAALVNLVNEERRDHILTIEDPIEYLHPSKRCLVNQRSVRRHTESFARALRAALREDPDVVVIGELRDLETISLAMTAAETGHFVLATLHTNDTIRTINRLVGAFPSDQQPQVRTMLSESLRAVLSQRLIPSADGQGRVPATELLWVNKAVGNLIRENKTFQIRSILQTGAAHGMSLMDQSLAQLVAAGTITKEEAARHAEDARKMAA